MHVISELCVNCVQLVNRSKKVGRFPRNNFLSLNGSRICDQHRSKGNKYWLQNSVVDLLLYQATILSGLRTVWKRATIGNRSELLEEFRTLSVAPSTNLWSSDSVEILVFEERTKLKNTEKKPQNIQHSQPFLQMIFNIANRLHRHRRAIWCEGTSV